MRTMEERLKNDLTADFAPDDALNRSILRQAKETHDMKRNHLKGRTAAAAAVLILAAGSLSVYAAYRYLTPSQVAEYAAENRILAEAFESPSAVCVNETQTTGGYDVTFLGTVSGSDLKSSSDSSQEYQGIQDKKTYAVVAVAKSDGTPMPGAMDAEYHTFCISPLIHGKPFAEMNNAVLHAGISSFVQDGVLYELLECDDLEIFSGMGVSLGVVENFGNESSAFVYDEATGTYSQNTEYDGIQALFELPLDISRADEEAAEAYFKVAMENEAEPAEEIPFSENAKINDWVQLAKDAWDSSDESWEAFQMQSQELTEYMQTVTPDAEGYIRYLTMDGALENRCYEGEYTIDAGVEVFFGAESDNTCEGTVVTTICLNTDGSFSLHYYTPMG